MNKFNYLDDQTKHRSNVKLQILKMILVNSKRII